MKIENEVFLGMRSNFNVMLQKLVEEMRTSGNKEGCITLKLKVETREAVDAFNVGYTKPVFEFDISAELKKKEKINGIIRDEYKLYLDEATNQYDIVPVPNEQIKMEI